MEPYEALKRWESWVARGTPRQVERVVELLDAKQTAGWRRATAAEIEDARGVLPTGGPTYACDPSEYHPEVLVTLDSEEGVKLFGSWVWIDLPRVTTSDRRLLAAWSSVMQFLDGCLAPAVREAGMELILPSAGDMFLADLPYQVRDYLKTFAGHAGRSLVMDLRQVEAWHDFVVAAFRARYPLDGEQLRVWLVEQGFPEAAAKELRLRYADESLVIDRYLSVAATL